MKRLRRRKLAGMKKYSAEKRAAYKFWGLPKGKDVITSDEFRAAWKKLGVDNVGNVPDRMRVHFHGQGGILVFTAEGEI